jgi:hypothetical protein
MKGAATCSACDVARKATFLTPRGRASSCDRRCRCQRASEMTHRREHSAWPHGGRSAASPSKLPTGIARPDHFLLVAALANDVLLPGPVTLGEPVVKPQATANGLPRLTLTRDGHGRHLQRREASAAIECGARVKRGSFVESWTASSNVHLTSITTLRASNVEDRRGGPPRGLLGPTAHPRCVSAGASGDPRLATPHNSIRLVTSHEISNREPSEIGTSRSDIGPCQDHL